MTELNHQDIAARIKFLIKKLGLSQAAFAKRLGIDPANLPNAGSIQAKVEEFEKEAKPL